MMMFCKFTNITIKVFYIDILEKQREHDLKYIKCRKTKSKVISFYLKKRTQTKRKRVVDSIANIATTFIKVVEFILSLTCPVTFPET